MCITSVILYVNICNLWKTCVSVQLSLFLPIISCVSDWFVHQFELCITYELCSLFTVVYVFYACASTWLCDHLRVFTMCASVWQLVCSLFVWSLFVCLQCASLSQHDWSRSYKDYFKRESFSVALLLQFVTLGPCHTSTTLIWFSFSCIKHISGLVDQD